MVGFAKFVVSGQEIHFAIRGNPRWVTLCGSPAQEMLEAEPGDAPVCPDCRAHFDEMRENFMARKDLSIALQEPHVLTIGEIVKRGKAFIGI